MKNILASVVGIVFLSLSFATPVLAATPSWNVTGAYTVAFNLGSDYVHDVFLAQDGLGNITGNGGYPAGGPYTYTWVITSGSVSGSTIDLYADYTASADAVTPLTTMHVVGTIAPNGTLSGTWSDNYQGGAREGSWSSATGVATPIAVSCPENTTRSASPMETVTVPATGAADTLSTNVLALGTSYVLNAYGTADAGDSILFDARYSFRTPTSVTWTDAVSTYESYGPQLLDLFYNGTTPWGNYSISHEYQVLASGNGSQAHFLVSDVYPSNNIGELKVDIYSCDPNAPTTGSISGEKYNDLNRNGKKDANEPGLPGWTIKLEQPNGTVITTAVTDANGNYSFTDLSPATYKVREVQKSGWKRMSKNPKPIVLIAGADVTDVDFGNAKKFKWEREDTNKDCERDDERGNYYSGHGNNHYEKDHNDKNHSFWWR